MGHFIYWRRTFARLQGAEALHGHDRGCLYSPLTATHPTTCGSPAGHGLRLLACRCRADRDHPFSTLVNSAQRRIHPARSPGDDMSHLRCRTCPCVRFSHCALMLTAGTSCLMLLLQGSGALFGGLRAASPAQMADAEPNQDYVDRILDGHLDERRTPGVQPRLSFHAARSAGRPGRPIRCLPRVASNVPSATPHRNHGRSFPCESMAFVSTRQMREFNPTLTSTSTT